MEDRFSGISNVVLPGEILRADKAKYGQRLASQIHAQPFSFSAGPVPLSDVDLFNLLLKGS